MSTSSILPTNTATVVPPVTFGTTPTTASSSSSSSTTGVDTSTIAGNFTEFLQLLTTQLQNQDPLDPLDTNQFTQQLVEFAQVEQQLKTNDSLSTLVSLQQTAQNTEALNFVGKTVGVAGNTAALTNGQAVWDLNVPDNAATATITVSSSTGQQVFSGNYTLSSGLQTFDWNGKDNNGLQWPDGNYTISVTAQDTNGNPVSVPTGIEGTVDSVDLTQSPPTLSIGGQNYTLNQITRIVSSN